MSESIFPFLPDTSGSQGQPVGYDVVVSKAYPGVEFIPTEPNGVYQAVREVSGTLYLATNCDWNPNSLRWEQLSPTNPANPAYLLGLAADGHQTRYSGPPTNVPGLEVQFVQIYSIDSQGLVHSTPTNITASGQVAEKIDANFVAGSGVQQSVREIHLTDTASSANSLLDSFYVNNGEVWGVDKTGTLVVGNIPFARITGYTPPSFNNATFTGTTTFTGPTHTEGAATFDAGIAVTGGETVDNLTITSSITLPAGASIGDAPAYSQAAVTFPAVNASVTIAISSSHAYPVGTGVIVSGTNGSTAESFRGIVTANNGTPQTSITVINKQVVLGNPTDTINANAVVSFSTPVSFTTSDGVLAIANTGSGTLPTYNVTTTNHMPAIVTSGYNVPAVNGTITLQVQQTNSFYPGCTVIVSSGTYTPLWIGTVTTTLLNTTPSLLTIKCIQIVAGTAGQSVAANDTLVTLGSSVSGATYRQQIRPAGAPGTVTLTLASLPGGPSQGYQVYAAASADTTAGGSQVMTGSGATWEAGSITVPDSGAVGPTLIDYIGTAVGGQAPSVTYQIVGALGSTNYIGVFYLIAYPV